MTVSWTAVSAGPWPSTVLSVHNEELKLLRPGALDAQAIEAATGVPVHG